MQDLVEVLHVSAFVKQVLLALNVLLLADLEEFIEGFGDLSRLATFIIFHSPKKIRTAIIIRILVVLFKLLAEVLFRRIEICWLVRKWCGATD
jgi:hypothetical protein